MPLSKELSPAARRKVERALTREAHRLGRRARLRYVWIRIEIAVLRAYLIALNLKSGFLKFCRSMNAR